MTDNDYTPAAPGDFFCPAGGIWYACQTGSKFVGCCTSDPCGIGCFGDRLRPAGFSTMLDNKIPGGTCGGDTGMWTCEAAPTFWGCCNSDPCMNNSTCPAGKLEAAVMSRPDQYEYFGALNVLLSSTLPSATSSPSASPSARQAPAPPNASSHSKVSGAVIGGAIGGAVAFLVIVGVAVFFLLRRKRRKQSSGMSQAGEHEAAPNKDSHMMSFSPQSSSHSPPPTYPYGYQGFSEMPQELSADTRHFTGANRYSELPAQTAAHRFSELPAGSMEPRELESPDISPRPVQTEFASVAAKKSAWGLGLTGTVKEVKR